MGAPSDNAEFLALVAQSNLIDPPSLDRYLKSPHAPVLADDPALLAGFLVRDGLLTRYQAEQLLLGKWRGFFIDRYKVLGMLGEGGMGKVFLCEHPGMRRQVAIKVLPPKQAADPAVVERFIREAQAIAALDHRNIVHAFDVAEFGGVHYLVMEYVKGCTLDSLVARDGPLSANRALDYLRQTAQGLHHAFEAGLVHRDIKPSNLLVAESGVVKILDLGLARFFHDGNSQADGEGNGSVMGTVDYMAPEQALGSAAVDNRADIYSLGATFYFALTGRSPFEGGTTPQKMLWLQVREPEPLEGLRPDIPPELIAIIRKMMAKDPNDRFRDPAELLTELPVPEGTSLEEPLGVVLPPEAPLDLTADATVAPDQQKVAEIRAKRRSPMLVLVLAGLSLVGAGMGAYFVLGPNLGAEAARTPTPAESPEQQRAQSPPQTQQNPPPVQKQPAVVAPPPVFLTTLPEKDVVLHGSLGKRGLLGFSKDKVVLKGKEVVQALAMHPNPQGLAHIRYDLNARYRTFTGTATLNDTAAGKTASAQVFQVKGDGKILWESRPIQKPADAETFTIDVTGVYRLELEVHSRGPNYAAHAVWAEPALQR